MTSDTSFARRRSLTRALQKAPARFRANLRERNGEWEEDVETTEQANRRKRLLEFRPTAAPHEAPPPPAPASNLNESQPELLFAEGNWQVTPAYLVLGKDTVLVRVIGRMHRHTSKPPKQEAWLGLGFTVVGLFAVLMYMALGTLKFNVLAIGCLIALLIAFIATAVNVLTLRGLATLALFDDRGEALCKLVSRDIKRVDRLEAAIREAITLNTQRNQPGRAIRLKPDVDAEA